MPERRCAGVTVRSSGYGDTVAAMNLSWLGEGVASGVAIIAVVGVGSWIRSKWRQQEQIKHLRTLIQDSYSRMMAVPEQKQNEFFWLLAVLSSTLQHRTPDLSHKRMGELQNVLAKADSTQKRSGISTDESMARYDWVLFEQIETVEWLGLDLASIRDQFSN
ncbi:MAG: hypothetical protein F4Z65_00615 [Acidobacteria bacterium]|nr:hypothetical protein [Acidobacteriota bacterium]MYI38548.1 hypothetical protein [Acidobacteriota bacterium]